jgi:formylglycine-generating enzyme
MEMMNYGWEAGGLTHSLDLAFVRGTNGDPFRFGEGDLFRWIELAEFWIGTTPVTQALWTHIIADGRNPAVAQGPRRPMENVSWDELHLPGGFLDRINASEIAAHFRQQSSRPAASFRLPSEAEWEYAARGGPHWRDGFRFSGSDEIDRVAWYDRKHGDHTQEVALKASNQLGLYDMCGNVWEWCEDAYNPEFKNVPADGHPYRGDTPERVLRGGCFHNWAIHCTVSKRYQIERQFHDGCIGFRLAFGD